MGAGLQSELGRKHRTRWQRPAYPGSLGGYVSPPPPDDSPTEPGFNAGWQHGSADDDSAAIRPYYVFAAAVISQTEQTLGAAYGPPTLGYYPQYSPLHGPHFRIGYHAYPGIADAQGAGTVGGSECDSTIGMPTRMRPPLMQGARGSGVWRTASPGGVRSAMEFVMTMPQNTGVVQPQVSRR